MPDTRSYVPPVKIGEVMRGVTIGVVEASKSSKFPVGSHATAMPGWTEFAVVNEKSLEKVEIPNNGRVTDALGVLGMKFPRLTLGHDMVPRMDVNRRNIGMTGLTAYFGLLEIGQVKAGDFVVVSGAAGATGSVVAQIAKLKGAKVLGIAGSEDKVQWLKGDMGLDEALNYKDPDFKKKFRDATKVRLHENFETNHTADRTA